MDFKPSLSSCSLLLFFALYIFSYSLSLALPDSPFSALRTSPAPTHFEVAPPLPSDSDDPSCSLLLLQQWFGNVTGQPTASALYSPPADCPAPWTYVVLELHASCDGLQGSRIAGVWLDGVEILRTTTVQPKDLSGAFWTVRKDVTKYSSTLSRSNVTLTVMFENTMNIDVLTGGYLVNVSLVYYGESFMLTQNTVNLIHNDDVMGQNSDTRVISEEPHRRLYGESNWDYFYRTPADLIVPISNAEEGGYWFKIHNESNVQTKQVQIPQNTYRAVLELYVSSHSYDEFWFSNLPTLYYKTNHLEARRANGSHRQVFVKIDDLFVGFVDPFPLMNTGTLNPFLWDPIVGIGSFDLPTYNLEITPFLGFLLDGNPHFFRHGITDSIPFWLVGANLHLWLDSSSDTVLAGITTYNAPDLCVKRDLQYNRLDGTFKVDADRKVEFAGWISSSAGNSTTYVSYETQFQNVIKLQKNGKFKDVEQEMKTRTDVRVLPERGQESRAQASIIRKYPLHVRAQSNRPGITFDPSSSYANVVHGFTEKTAVALTSGNYQSSVFNSQDTRGRELASPSGYTTTRQSLHYIDPSRCYSEAIASGNGKIVRDDVESLCAPSS